MTISVIIGYVFDCDKKVEIMDLLKNKILQLIDTHPKHYVKMIKKNSELYYWVLQNSLIADVKLSGMIYSAINQVTNVCDYGNIKKFDRISTGFINCGPANICKCTKNNISKAISKTKSMYNSTTHDIINNKRAATMLTKYGKKFNSQRADIKHIWYKPKISQFAYEKLIDFSWLNAEYNVKQRTLVDIADELGVYYSTVGEYCRLFNFKIRQVSNYSLTELEISDYIRTLGEVVVNNDWNILGNRELDIIIPGKIAIEVNGLYWHSYNPSNLKIENKKRHLDKTMKCQNLNIPLLHITDYEWYHKKEIIKNLIRTKLGINDRIYARKCILKEVSKSDTHVFLKTHHLQGSTSFLKSYGLYHNDVLTMLATVGKCRFSNNADYELLRVCSLSGVSVVGGLSKLLSSIKNNFKNTSLISYCDYSKSYGNSYSQTGFNLVRTTEPGYFWTDGTTVIPRYKSQKSKLKIWLSTFDSDKTETQNMFDAGYRRYNDCGNLVYLMDL